MKQFFKSVAATVVGIFAFGIIMGIFTFISLIGMLMSGDKPSLRDNSVMVMKLQGTINEQGQEDVMGQITGNSFNQLGLNEILSAIKKTKNEDKIKGIYLEPGALITDYATLQEIRKALEDFKKSGKWIIAYGDAMTQGCYYLASVANKLYINPESNTGRLARLGFRAHVPERPLRQVWRQVHGSEGGKIQEFHRTIY